MVELRAILIPSREVQQQRTDRRDPKAFELPRAGRRHHIRFHERRFEVHARTVSARNARRE